MNKYFNFSQNVRKKIETNPNLMSLLVRHFETPEENLSCLKIIGRGSMNTIYRVGQLDDGLWIALREFQDSNIYGMLSTIFSWGF
mgnify:CR=1 FL=1